MYENEFELSLLPEQPERGQDELLPEEFMPRHKPFDWAEEEAAAQPAPLSELAEPDEDGTVFRSRRSILEYDLPVDDPPAEDDYEISEFEPVEDPALQPDLPWPTAARPAVEEEAEPAEPAPAVPAAPAEEEEPDMSWLFDLSAMTPVTEAEEPAPVSAEQRAGLEWLFSGVPSAGSPGDLPAPALDLEALAQPAEEPAPAAEEQPSAAQPAEVQSQAPAAEPAVPAVPTAAPLSAAGRVCNGRTVLISGGDRGIGAAAAQAFWQAGYKVAILYHTNEAAARALVNRLGCDCCAVRCDVASYEACAAAFRVVERNFGPVEVLVCNAGIAQQKLFTDITPAEWQRMLDVNLTGAFNLCHLALPGMIRRKWGRILTVSSMWGQVGGSCEVHYSAAKAGLIGLTKALAKEEGPSGITVNCVAPGVIETDMMSAFSAEDKAVLAEETPVGRLGTPAEVAGLLVFLAGEQAAFITGQVFGVNGGMVV